MGVGNYENNENCVETASGKYLDLLNPQDISIWIEDIAVGLSRKCRFSGQCLRFYSVAEHSCLMFDRAHIRDLKKAVLLHDAAEAYLGDIPRPLKAHLERYREIERTVQSAVFAKFGVKIDEYIVRAIKSIDDEQLMFEARHLMPSMGRDWDFSGVKFDFRWMSNPPMCWLPEQAEREFLLRANIVGIRPELRN